MINRLITALSQELELSAEEIADTIWLALQIDQFSSEDIAPTQPQLERRELDQETVKGSDPPQPPLKRKELEQETVKNHPPEEQKAGIYPRNQQQTPKTSGLVLKVPDASSLREPLILARAFKPLMRRVASGQKWVLDEVATTEQIAEKGIWIPVLRPTLEPWLDLELVIDESISMQIWRHTIKELERLLKNYGIFRDVRIWGLMTNANQQIQIRRGIGATAKNQSPRSPKELIDPSGRRLVLVVSDCVSSLWRNEKVTPILELWAKQGSMAIVQMLPKWMWKRTALGKASEVKLRGLNPGVFNQNLIAQKVSLWDEIDGGVKVPVFTLEPDKAGNWALMLSGKGSIWVSGYVFKLETIAVKNESELLNLAGDLSAEYRVQGFRVTASPMARKLAGLLASSPVITLPIVRLIQETFLKDSLQVNVAEVFLGGLLKPLSEINPETNPDQVQYDFMEGVRELLLDSVPSDYVLNVVDEVSKYVAKKLGFSVADFAAVLKKEQPIINSDIVEEVGYFATVTAQVLRRLGGEYVKVADELEGGNKQTLNFLWKEGNTKIYSFCTDEPWTLPFDALVIPSGYRIGFGGQFANSFISFLGNESFSYVNIAINKAKDENKQAEISPELPLLVPLPSEIKSTFSKRYAAGSDFWIVLATVEDLRPSVSNAFQATQSIILKIADKGINRLVIPLLGTGNNHIPINKVVIAMLSAIVESLNNLSSNPLKEIIFVDKSENTIEIINQVTQSLLAQKNIDDVQLLSAQGIDYTQLRDLLAEGKWKEADEETAKVILQASGQEKRGWLDKQDMEKIPSIDLQTIDQLWLKYSNGKFGFSVQKQIWLSVGGQPGYYNDEIYEKFGENVGWYIKDQEKWLLWDEHIFTLDAPQGHLPRYLPSQQKRIRPDLFSRNDLVVLEKPNNLDNLDTDVNQVELISEKEIDFTQLSFATNPEPALPIVLLLDTSGSMSGQPINELNQGLVTFQKELNKDALASMRVEVAIIAFNSYINIVQDFVKVNQFQPPHLFAEGTTETGKAIEFTLNLIEDRKVVYKKSDIQYYRPWVLLITDGMPTDNWRNSAKMVRGLAANKKINFFAVGVDGADFSILSEIAPIDMPPLMLRKLAFTQLFKWLSYSISTVSRSIPGDQVTLPPTISWAKSNGN
ncbi:SAV_2336 N-terminal domain-related protein [Planktothrix mougeotii]|uniref:GUN4 domain-containing protein n=1 Tax=Planktothrix mougeotii LEGE 06226 TaxID=1828728 RepID=A0ABR9UAW3_9CYAN|nr:SAV_2336 N-terminal domain-related protein [Planktothrix mougeotii]MBE9142966.1 GUN4 domain-containing protein [Planktothrix mougeotii LEGE 06226]